VASFRFTDTIHHPLEACYVTMRDRMAELAPHLDGVKEIRVLERTEIAPGVHRILNEWISDYRPPPVVSRFLTPDMLRWLDRVVWEDARHAWRWEFETPRLGEVLFARGESFMRALSSCETEVVLAGEIEVRLERLPGLPAFIGRRVRPQVERFLLGLCEPRLRGIDRGLAAYLDAGRAT
jgi:hypothetical protein